MSNTVLADSNDNWIDDSGEYVQYNDTLDNGVESYMGHVTNTYYDEYLQSYYINIEVNNENYIFEVGNKFKDIKEVDNALLDHKVITYFICIDCLEYNMMNTITVINE